MKLLSFLMIFALGFSCLSSKRETNPNPTKLHFPIGIGVDPNQDYIYVVSTNFDMGYTGGVVVPISVETDEILASSAIEVGSFGGDIIIHGEDGIGKAGFLAIRDEDAIQFFKIKREDGKPILVCKEGNGKGLMKCDQEHTITEGKDPVTQKKLLPGRDLFGLAAGELIGGEKLLFSASILDGTLTVLSLSEEMIPKIEATLQVVKGLHSVVVGRLIDKRLFLYVTSRLNNMIGIVSVWKEEGVIKANLEASIILPQVTSSQDYFRGAAISSDGKLMFTAYRSPPSLVVFRIEDDGMLTLRGLIPLHGGPAEVAVAKGDGDLVYVTDFQGDGVYCIDPETMMVIDRIPVGWGPYGIGLVENRTLGIYRAYVTLFEEHGISIIDIDRKSPDFNREIKRIK